MLVGYNRRFDPTLLEIKSKLVNNEIGDVKYAMTTSRDYPYPREDYLQISQGIFHDCATHDIDYLNWLLDDKPISVQVVADNNDPDFNHDYVNIVMKYMNGTIANLNLSRIASSYDQRCEFYGSKGEIINNSFLRGENLSFPERYAQSYQNEIQYFAECILNKKEVSISRLDCLANFCIADACEKSCRETKKITVKYDTDFRNYEIVSKAISENYRLARTFQTYNFVIEIKKKYSNLDQSDTIWNILETLNNFIDISDPDCSHPNMYHALQTAEMMRKDGLPDWFQLIGLIHDMGKIMYLKGNDDTGTSISKQWAIVGDTFVVGCQLPNGIVFPEYNKLNPDMQDPIMSTKLGIYEEGCGLDNLTCSWGHDEYLYQILKSEKNPNKLPDKALYIIRYHSLYSYHLRGEYMHFQSEYDKSLFADLKTFNKYDLYSKSDEIIDQQECMTYYNNLINKYFFNNIIYY